jgi:hypothetical protein
LTRAGLSIPLQNFELNPSVWQFADFRVNIQHSRFVCGFYQLFKILPVGGKDFDRW